MRINGARVGTSLTRSCLPAAAVLLASLIGGCGAGGSSGDGGPASQSRASDPATTAASGAAAVPGPSSTGEPGSTDEAEVDWCGLLTAEEVAGFLGKQAPTEAGRLGCRWKTGENFGARGGFDPVLEVGTDASWETYVSRGMKPVPGIGTGALEEGNKDGYLLIVRLPARLFRITSFNLDPATAREAAKLVADRI